jgi:4-amino-4-deoxychorismate lyase
MPADATLFNGRPVPPDCFLERAFQFGDGLFETFAVIDGRPCLWSQHMRRLRLGCARLHLPPPDPDLLLEEALGLCAGRVRGVLKLVIGAGCSERGYARDPSAPASRWMRVADWPAATPWSDDTPLRLQHSRVRLGSQPLLAGLKHLNRLEQVLARRELRPGMHEAVMYDLQGRVVEAIAANLFLLQEGRLLTPPIEDCGVAGTVRQHLLEKGGDCGCPVIQAPLRREQLLRAEGLFLGNALLGIRPVVSLGDHAYAVTRRPKGLERLHRACFTFSGDLACNE